jgi:NAD(P)-dependent dehydrogenase (short-subunit alcohol dehydrogenase family)
MGEDARMELTQRVLVTGGASGIGWATAQRFAAAGAHVRICDIDPDLVGQANRPEQGIAASEVDVADADALTRWVEESASAMGGIDVLINNAGIAGPTAPVEDVTLEQWRRCLAVGLESHFLASGLVAPRLKQQRSGAIICISSTAGQFGYGLRTPYAAAKWAVIGLVKSLAIELGPYGVRVNAVCPGSVDGPRMQGVIAAEAKARGVDPVDVERGYVGGHSIKRFVRADEVADMCQFLASPQAAMVSGQTIAVDGHTETFRLA